MKQLFFLFFLMVLVSCKNQVDYNLIGKFEYKVVNDSLHINNSYLSPHSYGYAIGNLDFEACGIKISNIDTLNPGYDYITSLKPIVAVSDDSDKIKGEGMEYLDKKPLEITLKDVAVTDSVYIYRLQPKGKYRLLLP